MTEIDIGYGYGCVVESGRIVDRSGECSDTPKELLTFEYDNKVTNQRNILYGCAALSELNRLNV